MAGQFNRQELLSSLGKVALTSAAGAGAGYLTGSVIGGLTGDRHAGENLAVVGSGLGALGMAGRIAGPQFNRLGQMGELVFPAADTSTFNKTMTWLTHKNQGGQVRQIDRKSNPEEVRIRFQADPKLYDHIESQMGVTEQSGGQSAPINTQQAIGQTTPDSRVAPAEVVQTVKPSALYQSQQNRVSPVQGIVQAMRESQQPYTPSEAIQGVQARMDARREALVNGAGQESTGVEPATVNNLLKRVETAKQQTVNTTARPVLSEEDERNLSMLADLGIETTPTRRMTKTETLGAPRGTRVYMDDTYKTSPHDATPGRIWVHPNREAELKSWLGQHMTDLTNSNAPVAVSDLSQGSYFWQPKPGEKHPAGFTKMTGEPVTGKPGEFWMQVGQGEKDKAVRSLLAGMGYYMG